MFKLVKENIFKEKSYDGYVIESRPIRTIVSDEELIKLTEHINNGISDGLTEEEVKALLDWTVENTRNNIEIRIGTSIDNFGLSGYCGLAQGLSLLPLTECGMNVSVNNVRNFPYSKVSHAFGTIILPVKIGNVVTNKWYLIDTTYRQFFSSNHCQKSCFNAENKEEFCLYTPDPGYFMCVANTKSKKTVEFAQELLHKGYIELTEENLRMYALGFIYSSIPKEETKLYETVEKISTEELINAILNKQEEIDYDTSEFDNWGMRIRIPNVNYEETNKRRKI